MEGYMKSYPNTTVVYLHEFEYPRALIFLGQLMGRAEGQSWNDCCKDRER